MRVVGDGGSTRAAEVDPVDGRQVRTEVGDVAGAAPAGGEGKWRGGLVGGRLFGALAGACVARVVEGHRRMLGLGTGEPVDRVRGE